MSLISKQIDELRAYAKDRKGELAKLINDAADTIEMLSAKIQVVIEKEPGEDVQPVVHAHWIPDESETGEGSNTYKCSACGEIQVLIYGTPKENGWNYCPNCGAKMDEGKERWMI